MANKTQDRIDSVTRAILEAAWNRDPWPSPDASAFAFCSNRDGSPQIYVADLSSPEAPQIRRVTASRGHWSHPMMTPDGTRVLALRDDAGNENTCIYSLGRDGVAEDNLTPGSSTQRDPPFIAPGNPARMVYAARRHGSSGTAVVVQALVAGAPAATVCTCPGIGRVAGLSHDGSRALIHRQTSATESVLEEVDLATGAASRVFPSGDKPVCVDSAAYVEGSASVLVASDEGGDTSTLRRVQRATGIAEVVWRADEPATARIEDLAAAPDGSCVALKINAGNWGELRLWHPGAPRPPAVVAGLPDDVSLGAFSVDGKHLFVTASQPEEPWDIWAVRIADASVRRVFPPRPSLASLAGLEIIKSSVTSFDGLRVPVHAYRPRRSGRLPVLVFLHGGPASSATVGWQPIARFATALGYVVVEPNVRGSTGFGRSFALADDREKRGDVLRDLEAIHRWVIDQDWCDPSRIVLGGGSYGGYLTLLGLALQPRLWSAGVDMMGVYDLQSFMRATDQSLRSLLIAEFGDPERDEALLVAWSPRTHVGGIVAPTFVYAGANDPRVPRAESDELVAALRSRGVEVDYMVAGEEGHSLGLRSSQEELCNRLGAFLLRVAGPTSD